MSSYIFSYIGLEFVVVYLIDTITKTYNSLPYVFKSVNYENSTGM